MSKLSFEIGLRQVGASEMLPLWQQAPGATVFTHPEVLDSLSHAVHWWLTESAGVPTCAWPVCLDEQGRVLPPQLSYYVGPFWLNPPDPSPRRRLLLEVAVYQSMLNTLRATYGALRFSLPPTVSDLRPFLWFAPAADGTPSTLARPRYTACIEGLQGRTDEQLLAGFSYERRADARRAAGRGARRLARCSYEQLDALYRQLMSDRGEASLYARRSRSVVALWQLVERGFGYVVACADQHSDTVRAAWLILAAKGRACGVLAAADEPWRANQFNAFVCWQALIESRMRGAGVYDFNGANSLPRGSDKHSYGAEAALYFDLEIPAA